VDVTYRRMASSACLAAGVSLLVPGGRSQAAWPSPGLGREALLAPAARPARIEAWAAHLTGIEVGNSGSHETTVIRFYRDDGDIDDAARVAFERIAARDEAPHPLAARLEQLAFKAAYHFNNAAIIVVSGWRENAGRHGASEALDFKLHGVTPRTLAAYLRSLPRAGVGLYTHWRTQYVHLDVRDPSFHWVDGSPPGIKWHEAPLGDRTRAERDASWTPEMDLPL
jgi:hypothetical protein